jgi:hypothetical protein
MASCIQAQGWKDCIMRSTPSLTRTTPLRNPAQNLAFSMAKPT